MMLALVVFYRPWVIPPQLYVCGILIRGENLARCQMASR